LTPTYAPSVIINSDNQVLYAINPITGIKNWQFSLALPATGNFAVPSIMFQPSPLVYHNMVYIAGCQQYPGISDTIYKVNSETGALVAKFSFPASAGLSFNIQSTPVADANLIYFSATNDTLYAIDTGTGAIQWNYWAQAPMISSPVVSNGMVYCATTAGVVFALDKTLGPAATSGNWTCTIAGASFYSSPAVSAPYLYLGSVMDSNMYCIPLVDAAGFGVVSPRWSYKTHGSIYSSPAAEDGVCIFGSTDFNVYCLDTFLIGANVSPGARWITPTNSAINSSPVLVNNVVYIGSYDYFLYALNVIDGTTKWSFKTNALIKSSPLVYGGYVYIGSYDKNLYAIDTSLGTQRWSYNTNGQIECSPAVDDLSGIDQNNSQMSGFTN